MHREEKEITLDDTWDTVVNFRGEVNRLKADLTPLITEERGELKPDPWSTSAQQKSAEEEVRTKEIERIENGIERIKAIDNRSAVLELDVNLFSGDGGEGIELQSEWQKVTGHIDRMLEKLEELRDSLSTELDAERLSELDTELLSTIQ